METRTLLACLSLILSTGALFAEETKNGKADQDRDCGGYRDSISPERADRRMDRDRDDVGHCDINPTTPLCRDQTRRGDFRPRHCDINPNTPMCRGE